VVGAHLALPDRRATPLSEGLPAVDFLVDEESESESEDEDDDELDEVCAWLGLGGFLTPEEL